MTPEKIQSATPIVIAAIACLVGIVSIFTPYGKEGLTTAGLGLSGAAGLAQPLKRDSND